MAQDSSSPSPSLALPSRPTQPRRVPPPCWTHDETLALIDSYHEKWYSLRRGNLRAAHWQEVADSVAHRCPFANPTKTSVQCRHKIEKLRKRYRSEKERALTAPNRFNSSWVFFKKMDNMEKGPPSAVDSDDNIGPDDNDDDQEDDDEDDDVRNSPLNNFHHRPISNGSGSGGGGFRFRIPSGPRSSVAAPVFAKQLPPKNYEHPNPSFNSNTRLWSSCTTSKSGFGGRGGDVGGKKREMDPVAEMVASIKMLGEGFVKMEQMKMEMAREMEQMRMEMEMKRTEMILDSQQRIVEAFAKGLSARKKVKTEP